MIMTSLFVISILSIIASAIIGYIWYSGNKKGINRESLTDKRAYEKMLKVYVLLGILGLCLLPISLQRYIPENTSLLINNKYYTGPKLITVLPYYKGVYISHNRIIYKDNVNEILNERRIKLDFTIVYQYPEKGRYDSYQTSTFLKPGYEPEQIQKEIQTILQVLTLRFITDKNNKLNYNEYLTDHMLNVHDFNLKIISSSIFEVENASTNIN